jgi:hypothetical protein
MKQKQDVAEMQRHRLRRVIDPTMFIFCVGLTDYAQSFTSYLQSV